VERQTQALKVSLHLAFGSEQTEQKRGFSSTTVPPSSAQVFCGGSTVSFGVVQVPFKKYLPDAHSALIKGVQVAPGIFVMGSTIGVGTASPAHFKQFQGVSVQLAH
jgi:hypothetical protein